MSLTSRERSNPPPRRKSCWACIKAKRRCDGATPACLRCGHRRIPCEYPLRKTRRTAPARDAEDSESAAKNVGDQVPDSLSVSNEASLEHDPSAALLADLNDNLHCSASSLDFSLDPDSLCFELVHQPPVLPLPLTPHLHVVNGVAADVVSKQLQFALDETQRAIHTMATEMHTPWSHPMLFQDGMPTSIRDAHASCALYTLKTKTNTPLILRSIESYIDTLLTSTPPLPTLPSRLAHTQSLILYHIIRLLDGEIRARASAERQLGALEESAFAVLPYVDFDDVPPAHQNQEEEKLPLYPIGPARAKWRAWILHESARRTFLFALYFLQAYRIVSGSLPVHCDGRLALCRSLTVSKPLWGARDAVVFARAWNEGRFVVVRDCRFEGVLREGRAEDVDVFGRMLMASAMGIEEAEGWFADRGSSLRDMEPMS